MAIEVEFVVEEQPVASFAEPELGIEAYLSPVD
jgi:hypothetical protein